MDYVEALIVGIEHREYCRLCGPSTFIFHSSVFLSTLRLLLSSTMMYLCITQLHIRFSYPFSSYIRGASLATISD